MHTKTCILTRDGIIQLEGLRFDGGRVISQLGGGFGGASGEAEGGEGKEGGLADQSLSL